MLSNRITTVRNPYSMKSMMKTVALAVILGTAWSLPPARSAGRPPASAPQQVTALSPAEAATLAFIREEEKMARDVYLAMSDIWGLPIFAQIAASEQEHMDAIKRLLDKYRLPDPALGIGDFANHEIQDLYDALIAWGTESDLAALYVGAFIEEFDILDLQLAIDETDNADLDQVYGNLKAGSENHLRAFVGEIEKRGIAYTAQYLPQEVVDAILAASREFGRRR